jgi:hypothetical protein
VNPGEPHNAKLSPAVVKKIRLFREKYSHA